MGHCKSSPKREIHSNIGLFQEIRKITIKYCKFIPTGTTSQKREQRPKLVEEMK